MNIIKGMMYRAFISLILILSLIIFNILLFGAMSDSSYFGWYLEQGATIGFVSAFLGIVWGNLDKHTGLISANPTDYVGACFQLIGLPFIVLAQGLGGVPKTNQTGGSSHKSNFEGCATLFNFFIALPLILFLAGGLIVWLVVIAPLQYFIFLICGAPSRYFLQSERRVMASLTPDGKRLDYEIVNKKGYFFYLGLSFVSELDAGQLSDKLRGQFKDHDVALTSKAQIIVEQGGNEWTIHDVGRMYLIRSGGQTLEVSKNVMEKTKSIDDKGKVQEGWWDASIQEKPFLVTSVISSILFLALQQF